MANNQSALCDSARALLAKLNPDYSITPDDRRVIESLCASYVNLCEAQQLATARADNAQTLLAQAQTTIAQLRLNLAEAEAMFESEHAQRKQTEAAYQAVLAGEA